MTELEQNAFEAKRPTDKVRASRDGHTYHEVWAARSALELLPPSTSLRAIALEGFSVEDADDVDSVATEIADLVRYHDSRGVRGASLVEVVQFKYSVANPTDPIRAADLTKTLTKFANTDAQFRTIHGDELVEGIVRYEFATNRPMHENLLAAITAIENDEPVSKDVARQAKQLRDAIAPSNVDAASLLKRLTLAGSKGSLKQADAAVRHMLANWSEASDPESVLRLLKLKNLVRTKVGSEGDGDNLIDRVAILVELGVDHENVLYPTPDAFPPVALRIARPIVQDVVTAARTSTLPIVVHGAGGMGKTVLMQELADQLSTFGGQVVLFDGFGAGKWRDPADGRHLPERTLVHLANILSGRTLCDILLPINDTTSLLTAFRKRLTQAVSAARQGFESANIILLLDAIDHAAMQGKATGKLSFAHLLLQSLAVNPIEGVIVIASCRTERLALAVGGASYQPIEVPAFSKAEAEQLINLRDPTANATEVAALQGRSGRNPRCLDTLLAAGRPYDGAKPGGINANPDEVLDALLQLQIDGARASAKEKGASDNEIDILLSALSILPPPVPPEELAAANGLTVSEIESFATDLFPLLERTPHGLMFRDEPTETLIRKIAQHNDHAKDAIVQRLLVRQSESSYAARALPAVLVELGRLDELVALAFDERVPANASKVSERDIRLARILSALAASASAQNVDDMVRLLLEASIVAAGHERSDRFLYEHPDLTAISKDSEAVRRLFQTKCGWPGGRHSALAIAHAFSGDIGEAKRNSQRSIDWFNLANSRDIKGSGSTVSPKWDDVGFTYVEMLSGNDARVALWFARRDPADALEKFGQLLDLLERNPIEADGFAAIAFNLRKRLKRCRITNRPFWLAALKFSDGSNEHDRRCIRKLAKKDDTTEPYKWPLSARLAAGARAISLGMKPAARIILDGATVSAGVHDYSSYWPGESRPERSVIAAGLKSALKAKPAELIDIAPTEFLSLVPKYIQRKGSEAFEAELLKRLSGKTQRPMPKRRSRAKKRSENFDYDKREQYVRAKDHRIKPLLVYCNFIGQIVSPPKGKLPADVMLEALECLQKDVASASNYPYRDGTTYIARIGITSLFRVADAVGAFNQASAQKLVDCIKQFKGLFTPELTKFVARLSRLPECHDAALDLASHVESVIVSDTDTSSRIAAYGALARAVWRVSSEEAGAYFRRGLELADAIGSDDFNRTNHLLALTNHYKGSELSPEAGYNLMRILELNQPEEGKFPWNEYACSLAPVAGLHALACISRLDDRDQASLDSTLAPMLAKLVDQGKLDADIGAALVGMAEPYNSWTWRLDSFAASILPHLDKAKHEWFFELLLTEIDRSDYLRPIADKVNGLLDLAKNTLPPTSAAITRLAKLAERRKSKDSDSPALPTVQQDESLYEAFDIFDPYSIDKAVLEATDEHAYRTSPVLTLRALAKRAITPEARLKFVRAIVVSSASSLSDKLMAIEDDLIEWSKHSLAFRDALPEIATALATKHAEEMVGNDWQADYIWRKLARIFGADRTVLTTQLIASLGPAAAEVSGDSWLGLSTHLADKASAAILGDALERFLVLSGRKIPEEVGDGEWKPALLVEGAQPHIIAQLIWTRLGNYQASERWRAAHAIRRLAEVGRFDVIDELVCSFAGPRSGAFTDAKLPFYLFHAQLWLLIALQRVSRDFSSAMLAHREFFESIAFNSAFPHVAMHAYAGACLENVAQSLNETDAENLRQKIASINVSPFERNQSDDWVDDREFGVSDDEDTKFGLEYDFRKYQATELAGLFGITVAEVETGMTKWVRQWDKTAHGMYDCPRSSSDYGSRTDDKDRYGAYLGWHALMLLAGQLLPHKPIIGRSWSETPWENFLREFELSRNDGLWLADVTDRFPIDLIMDVEMVDDETPAINPADRELLGPMVGFSNDGLLGERLVVDGHWSLSGDDINLSVCTALANKKDAEAAILATITETKFHQWLPHSENDLERYGRQEPHSIRAWIADSEDRDRRIDRNDPYASSTAPSRPSPEAWVIEENNLEPDDSVCRAWKNSAGFAFWTEVWGTAGGRGESAWDVSGERIAANTRFLLPLLKRKNLVLIGLVKARKYTKRESRGDFGDTSSFSHLVMPFLLDGNGKLTFPTRISAKTRAAISALQERYEFHLRFDAIRATC